MRYDLGMQVRECLRSAAVEFLLEQVQTVADEIANAGGEGFGYIPVPPEEAIGDSYIPEVEQGGARDFGQGPIIGREERKEASRGILGNLTGQYADLAAWVAKVAEESSPEADQDHGDTQGVAGPRREGACTCWLCTHDM